MRRKRKKSKRSSYPEMKELELSACDLALVIEKMTTTTKLRTLDLAELNDLWAS